MKRFAIVGYGLFGKRIEHQLKLSARTGEYLFFDDTEKCDEGARIYPFSRHIDSEFADCEFHVGLGYKHLDAKYELIEQLARHGRILGNAVHSSANIDPSAVIQGGVVVMMGASVAEHARLASGVYIGPGAIVAHDCEIMSSSYISPGAILCGGVVVKEKSFIGAGSVVANGVVVGSNCRIGMGSMVTKSLDDGVSAVGNPLRVLQGGLNLR